MQLAAEVARLADVAERMLERDERDERDRHAAQLQEHWGHAAPSRVGLGLFLRAIPGLAARFERVVPEEFTAQVDDGLIEIACPCGEQPTVAAGQLARCECERWFLHAGAQVHVARFDAAPDPEPDPEP